MRHYIMALCLIAATLSCSQKSKTTLPVYLDRSKTATERAMDIVGRLTLQEKASLMRFESPAIERLGIKKYNWWNEALHGVARNGDATMYPMPIGMAASFDPELLKECFDNVSNEGRIKNRLALAEKGGTDIYEGLSFWTPNINIYRDPRWGRGMETYGEDPYLTSIMGGAVVEGLQGDPKQPKTIACAKHFAVHSGPEGDRHHFDVTVSERDLRETYLPAFKYLVQEKNVQEVMFAYNRFRGVPCGMNTELLQDILRNEWGYDGIIVSDCGAVDDIYQGHHYLGTAAEASAASIHAGTDLECGWSFHHLVKAVEEGLIAEDELTQGLVRLFKARYELGEMDGESVYDRSVPEDLLCCEQYQQQSLKMAEESLVLLKNDILPLQKDAKVALVGPNGDDVEMLWGNYNAIPNHTITLRAALEAVNPEIPYVRGCELVSEELSEEALKSVVDSLSGIETVIFAGGISPRVEGEEMPVDVPGFVKGDRTDIELPAVQRQLISALAEAGKKVILVNFSGGAMGLGKEISTCAAILQAWYPGQEGGTAVARALYGDCNPSGKLPVTFYKSVADLPDFSDYDMAGHTYRYFGDEVLFPFGYGLSYSSFSYGQPVVRGRKLIVKVTNTSDRDGVETVQLYVRKSDDLEGPIKTLRGFQRVNVPAGKTIKVILPLNEETFQWWSEKDQNMVPLHGSYELLVGPDSQNLQKVEYKF